jgi:tetratricopeptide (TPR) repeat protein
MDMSELSACFLAPFRLCLTVAGLVVFLAGTPLPAADAWHLPGWQARAVVEIPKPSAEPGVDTAGVKVLCQGRAKADGSDYRVLDAAGKPVPFQIMFHDAGRYSLISFRATDPRQRFFIYFGNPQAARAAEEVVVDPKPGAGPPKAAWAPHYGLVLQTIQRPEGPNPKTPDDMARLIASSPYKHGARYQRRIADGYNSFGSSDYYISIYRGWLQLPKAGKYQFCTVSNEASFSFLDGKPLVHWPGRHTVERGIHGEKNTTVELTAGLHYIEYYHEEVTLEQMAYLGWRPAGQVAFSGIPESVYTAPHAAAVVRYEDTKGPLLHFEPVILDSVWPTERHEGQYTRCRFEVGKAPPLPAGATYQWDFGDGQTATGSAVDHVYLTLGKYTVTLTAKGPAGTSTARWPLEVFEIEHVTDQFKEGRPREYASMARTYDRGKLDAPALKELAHLLAENEAPADALDVGKEFVRRFGSSKLAPDVRRLMADCAIRTGRAGIDEAIRDYEASITRDTPPAEKLEVLARLIRLLGIERNLPEKVTPVLAEVEKTYKAARPDDDTQAAYRKALVAAGDVLLWHKNADGARDRYQEAEAAGPYIPAEVRAARVGSYPNAIRELIDGGNYGSALDSVERWENRFPTEKLKGQTFFWRGKLLELRGQPREAARVLGQAVRLATGAAFESEARWLLAEALEKTGQREQARRELARLVASGVRDSYADRARKKLEQALKAGRK